jgi:5-methyltetrahydrofolate--homocysteine methyltransferase
MTARLTAIDRAEALRYLGCRAAPPPELLDDLSRCESLLFSAAKPRAVWRLFDLTPSGGLSGTDYAPGGQDIRAFLSGCEQLILMAATLGAEAEALLRRSQSRSMADAVILDAVASAAIENVCDNLCADLERTFFPRFLTGRYSPGYGDLPLSEQEKICRILDLNRRIGVSLTEGGLMIPQKSVTAFIGVSDTPQRPGPQGCEACGHAQNCAFRKDGKSCARE